MLYEDDNGRDDYLQWRATVAVASSWPILFQGDVDDFRGT